MSGRKELNVRETVREPLPHWSYDFGTSAGRWICDCDTCWRSSFQQLSTHRIAAIPRDVRTTGQGVRG